MPHKVLIVEDDAVIAEVIRTLVAELGHLPTVCADGIAGRDQAVTGEYRLAILDVNLPGMDGFDICRELRVKVPQVGILLLTSRKEEVDKVVGLEVGADDYLTKPFSNRELSARIKALLRRLEMMSTPAAGQQEVLVFDNLEINLTARKVTLDGSAIDLSVTEFDILAFLALRAGVPVSRTTLIEEIWGTSLSQYEENVTPHINRLRRKLEKDLANPRFVLTVRGIGYRLAEAHELTSS